MNVPEPEPEKNELVHDTKAVYILRGVENS